ncbi:9014_t:CDS:2, partial [Ambispora leptoticha]
MSVNSRYHYAYLALGEKRRKLSFYADLYQEKINQEFLYPAITSKNNNLVDNFCNDLESLFEENDPTLDKSIRKFV